MDKKEKKYREKEYKALIKELSLSPEQVSYLLTQYTDEDCIIGIHNAKYIPRDNFFKTGLRNYTSMDEESNDLSNTVNYSDNLWTLLAYCNLNNESSDNISVILKIPKKVIEKEQGIFERLPDEYYGIPSQFIVGAFENGQVFDNENYDKYYNNENAIKEGENFKVIYNNKIENADLFTKQYNKANETIKDRIKRFFKKITGKNKQEQLLLNSGKDTKQIEESTNYKSKAEAFRESLAVPTNGNNNVKRIEEKNIDKENDKQKDDKNELEL